jgi:predicted DNA-binding transcriptional regulator AlpA
MNYRCDRIIDKHELKELVPFSGTHIRRLEISGSFPKRVRIGMHRIGWSLLEVESWISEKKANRQSQNPISRVKQLPARECAESHALQ